MFLKYTCVVKVGEGGGDINRRGRDWGRQRREKGETRQRERERKRVIKDTIHILCTVYITQTTKIQKKLSKLALVLIWFVFFCLLCPLNIFLFFLLWGGGWYLLNFSELHVTLLPSPQNNNGQCTPNSHTHPNFVYHFSPLSEAKGLHWRVHPSWHPPLPWRHGTVRPMLIWDAFPEGLYLLLLGLLWLTSWVGLSYSQVDFSREEMGMWLDLEISKKNRRGHF